MFVNNGFASSDYIISEKDNSIYLDNPLILVVSKPIKEISQIVKTLEYIKSIERPLVIFSPDIKKEPLSVLLYNRRKENMDVR
jgi:chaperonin GroEL (HSP60 family)